MHEQDWFCWFTDLAVVVFKYMKNYQKRARRHIPHSVHLIPWSQIIRNVIILLRVQPLCSGTKNLHTLKVSTQDTDKLAGSNRNSGDDFRLLMLRVNAVLSGKQPVDRVTKHDIQSGIT